MDTVLIFKLIICTIVRSIDISTKATKNVSKTFSKSLLKKLF